MAKLLNNSIFGTHSESGMGLISIWVRDTDPTYYREICKEVSNLARVKKGKYSFYDGRLNVDFDYTEKVENREDHRFHLSFTFEFADPSMREFMKLNVHSYCQLMIEKYKIDLAKELGKTNLPITIDLGPSIIDPEIGTCFGPFIPGSLIFKETRDYGDCLMLDHSFIEFAPGINGATPDIYSYIKKIKNNEQI